MEHEGVEQGGVAGLFKVSSPAGRQAKAPPSAS
jgi:hypothetical protein